MKMQKHLKIFNLAVVYSLKNYKALTGLRYVSIFLIILMFTLIPEGFIPISSATVFVLAFVVFYFGLKKYESCNQFGMHFQEINIGRLSKSFIESRINHYEKLMEKISNISILDPNSNFEQQFYKGNQNVIKKIKKISTPSVCGCNFTK